MEYKDDMSNITLRKCDLNATLVMATNNNKELIKSIWKSLEFFSKIHQGCE